MVTALGRRGAALALALSASSPAARAERPPPRERPAPELFTNLDGGTDTPGARFIATLPPKVRETLKKDAQVVLDTKATSGGPALVRAVVRFDRPRDEVWALVTQPSKQSTFLPHVDVSKLVGERTAESEINDYVVAFIFTFKYRTQHWFYPDIQRVEWQLDPSGEDGMVEQLGFWQLYELDAKTTVAEYGTRIVVRGAFLNFLRSLGERGGVADALTAFRKHINTAKP
jgi:hypothetical protein